MLRASWRYGGFSRETSGITRGARDDHGRINYRAEGRAMLRPKRELRGSLGSLLEVLTERREKPQRMGNKALEEEAGQVQANGTRHSGITTSTLRDRQRRIRAGLGQKRAGSQACEQGRLTQGLPFPWMVSVAWTLVFQITIPNSLNTRFTFRTLGNGTTCSILPFDASAGLFI